MSVKQTVDRHHATISKQVEDPCYRYALQLLITTLLPAELGGQ